MCGTFVQSPFYRKKVTTISNSVLLVLNMNTLSANLKPSSLNYLSNFKIMLGITIKRMKGMFLLIISLNVDRENQLKECKSPLQGQGDK